MRGRGELLEPWLARDVYYVLVYPDVAVPPHGPMGAWNSS